MISKSDLIALASGIDDKTLIQIEQEARHRFVIDFPPSVGLILADDLAAIFIDEFVLGDILLRVYAPTGYYHYPTGTGKKPNSLYPATSDTDINKCFLWPR